MRSSALLDPVTYVPFSDTVGRSEMVKFRGSRKLNPLYRSASTSGTTGVPMVFSQPLSALQSEQAFIDYCWSAAGYKYGDKVAVIRGVQTRATVTQFGSRLILSSSGWTPDDIYKKYIALCKFKPKFIHCYPSLLERFITQCVSLGLTEFPRIDAVLAGSEATFDSHELLFLKVLGAKTVAWYGQSEQVALGIKAAEGRYNIFRNYSDVVFIPCAMGFEIAGKSRFNPLFSEKCYRTGDYCSSVEAGFDDRYGLPVWHVDGLEGRDPAFITAVSGETIPINHIIFGYHSDQWISVDRYCFIQGEPGELIFAYAANQSATVTSITSLVDSIQKRLPEGILLREQEVKGLGSLESMKWRYFFSDRTEFDRLLNKSQHP